VSAIVPGHVHGYVKWMTRIQAVESRCRVVTGRRQITVIGMSQMQRCGAVREIEAQVSLARPRVHETLLPKRNRPTRLGVHGRRDYVAEIAREHR